MIKKLLDERVDLQQFLFIRGFLITDKEITDIKSFPFYNNWRQEKHGEYWYMAHNLTGMHIYTANDNKVFFLFGHAYNPITMQHDELEILKYLSENYKTDRYVECLNELTGIYVAGVANGTEIEYHVDASGMQSACYGKVGENFYISSHPQLIGDICSLSMDDFVKTLINYKWYNRVMGSYLPADMTPFKEVKRIVPSIMYNFGEQVSHNRFWFNNPVTFAKSKQEYNCVIQKAAEILKNNMILIARKWQSPAISLTGGIDSNTTFSAANGNYDKYETFSYLSAPKEVPDAAAAKEISKRFNIKHTEFNVPDSKGELADYDLKFYIINHNNGYISFPHENEIRKRIYLQQNCTFDVEVKSWASETIRAYWYKHYGRKKMPKLSPKLFRNLYKIFIFNRKLALNIDKIFDEYIRDFEYDKIPSCYPPADMHYNEVTWGSWGGLNISEMKYCLDITIPYNNRLFFDLLFRVPLDKRISDQHHLDMKKYLNQELYDMNIRVVNMKETKFRAFALNVIFTINSILPF